VSAATSERGVAAGLDALLFGTLILLAGAVLIVNLWSVVESRTALDAAAREYLRTYTASADGASASVRGEHAARTVLDQRGTPMRALEITAPDTTRFGPCESSTVRLTAVVPAVELPFLARLGALEVSVTATELVPPHREVTAGPNHEPGATPCAR
jgi:hypothetical protein